MWTTSAENGQNSSGHFRQEEVTNGRGIFRPCAQETGIMAVFEGELVLRQTIGAKNAKSCY